MLNQKQLERIRQQLPMLKTADYPVLEAFQQNAFFVTVPTGKEVLSFGDYANAIPLLISGVVRVYKVGDTGREITLYRFGTGESCILTATAILNEEAFSAIATVEQEAQAVMIPSDVFRDWVDQYAVWRNFVFTLLSQRLLNVIELVDEVAFERMDRRIATLLLKHSNGQQPLKLTHQEIADELGSSREVISRILGSFAQQNIIQLGRGTIEILDQETLRTYAAM